MLRKLIPWVVVLSLVLTACVQSTPQTITVKETVVVEKPVEKVVEKPVEKLVEKLVQVTPTPLPIGRQLIGKLQFPTIIADAAAVPKKFNQAPMLADLVKAGKLPLVEQRLPEQPLVVKPFEAIGTYGGIWRRGFTGAGDYWNARRCCAHDHVLYWAPDMSTVVPNIAQGWSGSDDGKVWTIYLRKGMKWSDGAPLTADDFTFWFEDMYSMKEVLATLNPDLPAGSKVEKVDDYTVRFTLARPNFMFDMVLAGFSPIASQSSYGYQGTGMPAPKHYLKQFHPKYTAKDVLDKTLKAEGQDNWGVLIKLKNDWGKNPDLPVLTPWKTKTPLTNPTWVLERNPYYWEVDPEGNQLPYIDYVVLTVADNTEIINLRAIAGEYDNQERHLDLAKLPLFLANAEKGGYKVRLDPSNAGSQAGIMFNMNYDKDPEIAKWINTTDFRRALALGIDRNQINESFFLGLGTPSSVVPADNSPQNPGPEWRTRWATYDLAKANQMLDQLGLDKKDAEGYRLRTDGKGRLKLEIVGITGSFLPYPRICEMVRNQWKKLGIDLTVREVAQGTPNLWEPNEHQMSMWESQVDILLLPGYLFPNTSFLSIGPYSAKWFDTRGKEGREPPARIKEVMQLWWKATETKSPDERNQMAKEMWKILADEVWTIGTVGIGPIFLGTRTVKNNMGNVPERHIVNTDGMTPGLDRTETFFWKK